MPAQWIDNRLARGLIELCRSLRGLVQLLSDQQFQFLLLVELLTTMMLLAAVHRR